MRFGILVASLRPSTGALGLFCCLRASFFAWLWLCSAEVCAQLAATPGHCEIIVELVLLFIHICIHSSPLKGIGVRNISIGDFYVMLFLAVFSYFCVFRLFFDI